MTRVYVCDGCENDEHGLSSSRRCWVPSIPYSGRNMLATRTLAGPSSVRFARRMQSKSGLMLVTKFRERENSGDSLWHDKGLGVAELVIFGARSDVLLTIVMLGVRGPWPVECRSVIKV